jgi:hypothetical protein
MPRIRLPSPRLLLYLAAMLSLILCGAFISLWLASRSYSYTVYRLRSPITWSLSTTTRSLVLGATRFSGANLEGHPWRLVVDTTPWPTLGIVRWEFLGFAVSGHSEPSTPTNSIAVKRDYFMAPYWFLVILSALLPAYSVTMWYKQRRPNALAKQGRCPTCGYDLRATPARCPECGATAHDGRP